MLITSELPGWLANAIRALQTGDINGWMSIYAPDAVHEFPFAPEGSGSIRRLEGRDVIKAYISQLPKHIRFGPLSEVRVHEFGEELVIDATGHHHNIPDGAPRTIGYIWFIVRRSDKVIHIRDYMSPIASVA